MKKIVIQGLGYVGLAMMSFCAGARHNGKYLFNVVGIEKNSSNGKKIIDYINSGLPPRIVDDKVFLNFYSKISKDNRLRASIDLKEYSKADIIFVCSNCDYNFSDNKVELKKFVKNINDISKKIKDGCLLIIQTTLPPGTTYKILKPLIKKNINKRGLRKFYLCHSFERITPGKDYYHSMKTTERIVGSDDIIALNKTKKVFRDIFKINSNKVITFNSSTESETCKIIENSYRATNIAFIEEWRNFCSKNNLDLEKILSSIRQRKTHNNIMRSGIGVGGYCLTKDPLFGKASSKQVFFKNFEFPLSTKAVDINHKMTLNVMSEIQNKFKDKIFKKKILLIGVSYREDTNDTRYSPAQEVYDYFGKLKCKINFYDPLVNYWSYSEQNSIDQKIFDKFDVYVHLINHKYFRSQKFSYKKKSIILDLNHVLNISTRKKLKKAGYNTYFIGSKNT
jgi:UDP-N-acetyl-D-glucosamine dehydrogenase